jgi:hypothetical protein
MARYDDADGGTECGTAAHRRELEGSFEESLEDSLRKESKGT